MQIRINSKDKLNVKVYQQGCLGQLLSDHTCPNWIWTSEAQFQQQLFKCGRAAIWKLFDSKAQTMY